MSGFTFFVHSSPPPPLSFFLMQLNVRIKRLELILGFWSQKKLPRIAVMGRRPLEGISIDHRLFSTVSRLLSSCKLFCALLEFRHISMNMLRRLKLRSGNPHSSSTTDAWSGGGSSQGKDSQRDSVYPSGDVQGVFIEFPNQATAAPVCYILGSVLHLCKVGAHCI